MKIVNLKHLSNLNEFFRKDVSYDKTKSYKKKQGFTLSMKYSILKNYRRFKLTPESEKI